MEAILLVIALLLLTGIIASKTSGKLGVPVLALFLAVGMLAGSEGLGGINFDNAKMAQSLGIFALTFILFSGGLDTKWEMVRPVMWQGIMLSTFGVMITALTIGYLLYLLTEFTFSEGLLLGAIVSSTDAAAVFSILRSKNIGLRGRLRPLLEFESGSNDPMAFFLTILMVSFITGASESPWSILPLFFQQMIIGGILGIVMGKLMVWMINKIKLEHDGLYPVFVMALVLLTFSASSLVNGNGFLAVYLAALILGNSKFIHKKSLMKFFDGQAWLMQIIMFITLGLLVFPSRMVPLIGIGLLISFILIFIARPLGVYLSLLPFKMKTREVAFISWVGLRGAVPIVFATYPMLANVEKSDIIFNIVFFVVLTSVLIQGTSIPLVAKWLKCYKPERSVQRYPLEIELTDSFKNILRQIEIPENAFASGKSIVNLGFPRSSLIVIIERNNQYITPNGASVIQGGDKLLIMTDKETELEKVRKLLLTGENT